MLELFSLAGRTVLVSGASRGLGKAIALGYGAAGATVLVTAEEPGAHEVAAEIRARSGQADSHIIDVTDLASIEQGVADLAARHGRIDVLVNVAGINKREPLAEVAETTYDRIMGVNLKGLYFMAQAVGKVMIPQGSGKVIHIASQSGHRGLPDISVYSASKGGVLQLTRQLAVEWARHNIQVNSISPGFMLTDLSAPVWETPAMQAWRDSRIPAGHLGMPEELVGTAIFLASAASNYVTGQDIAVDGGVLAGDLWPLGQ